MRKAFSLSYFLIALIPFSGAQSAELTGRFSILGSAAQSDQKESIFGDENDLMTGDQQSLRLMLEGTQKKGEWSVHLKAVREHLNGFTGVQVHSSDLFRYSELSNNWLEEMNPDSRLTVGYEIDRAAYKYRLDKNLTLSLGRQPIDWGAGRFWQPLNVFGAFAPTDLDTDFKPGIDATVIDWYPSAFSSFTAVYVPKPDSKNPLNKASSALYYRRQVAQQSEMSLLMANVVGNDIVGASFESEAYGIGWRIEGAYYQYGQTDKEALFWVGGLDYQFDNGALIAVEWYEHSRGADNEKSMADLSSDEWVAYGLQPHLARRVLGATVEKDITPLLHGSYALFVSAIDSNDDVLNASTLHQFKLSYSVSDESDFLFSMLFANGKGLNSMGVPQSEFGYTPANITARYRLFF